MSGVNLHAARNRPRRALFNRRVVRTVNPAVNSRMPNQHAIFLSRINQRHNMRRAARIEIDGIIIEISAEKKSIMGGGAAPF